MIRIASPGDAIFAAELADKKRAEYEPYSRVFWRRAADARERHEPFLRQCLGDEGFAAFTAEDDGQPVGIVLANRRGAPPPFHTEPDTWMVDDFFVADPDHWDTDGRALLDRVADEARTSGARQVIVVTAHRDGPKCAFLEDAGLELAASWWVHPVSPDPGTLPELGSLEAITGPAPPVYEPGGLTALVLSPGDEDPATAVPLFDHWTAASNAVLAIFPARTGSVRLENALEENGYEAASAWFRRALRPGGGSG